MSPKETNNRLCSSSKTSQNQRKLKALRCKCLPVSSAFFVHGDCSTRSVPSGTPRQKIVGDECGYELEIKPQSTVAVFEPERKLCVEKSLRRKWWTASSAKLVIWLLFHLSIVGRSILSATPQFVCLKSSDKFEKRTKKDESLFTMTMRAVTHRLKRFFTGQNVELMGLAVLP